MVPSEEYHWFALAEALHMSVRRCRAETDSVTFTKWLAYWRVKAMFHEQAAAQAEMERALKS